MGESEKMPRRAAKKTRCAIYTRKSSEEGLEQAFNSLDAQREACTAFIASQKHEGWTVLPVLYDDGGFSGGTMQRPALKRLIADIEAGQIEDEDVLKPPIYIIARNISGSRLRWKPSKVSGFSGFAKSCFDKN
jgi:Resolvase, N terminal domain